MADKKFKDGDVVILKSGGPKMTVDSYQEDGTVWCTWFVKAGGTTGQAFKESSIELDASVGGPDIF